MMAGAEVTPPPPARQWPARIAACLALTQDAGTRGCHAVCLVGEAVSGRGARRDRRAGIPSSPTMPPRRRRRSPASTRTWSSSTRSRWRRCFSAAPRRAVPGSQRPQSRVVAIVVAVLASVCCICAGLLHRLHDCGARRRTPFHRCGVLAQRGSDDDATLAWISRTDTGRCDGAGHPALRTDLLGQRRTRTMTVPRPLLQPWRSAQFRPRSLLPLESVGVGRVPGVRARLALVWRRFL